MNSCVSCGKHCSGYVGEETFIVVSVDKTGTTDDVFDSTFAQISRLVYKVWLSH